MSEELEWTTDMNVARPEGVSNKMIADSVMESLLEGTHFDSIAEKIISKFSLSDSDAYLAIDRTQGGIVRALTGNPQNKPDWKEDPIALCSFEEVWKSLKKKSLFSSKRVAVGIWNDWYEQR